MSTLLHGFKRRSFKATSNRQRGFSLIEVLVSTLILIFGLLGVAGLLINGIANRVGAAPAHVNTTGGKMIYFGTGSYLSATDSADTTSQRLYGIFDATTSTSNPVAYASEASLTSMAINAAGGADVRQIVTVASGSEWYTVATKRGWYVPCLALTLPLASV